MAPSPPKTMKVGLPDHLLQQVIMPRLPFKTINRWKCLSKEIHSLITNDAWFAEHQARLAVDSSDGYVHMTPRGLSFYPNPASTGVPDPSLSFLNPSRGVKLLASTNGLLLLCGKFGGVMSVCVCNPATKDTVFVQDVNKDKYCPCEMGFVYDPCKEPHRYTIVDPVMGHEVHGGRSYKFDVFHSDTGKWTRSSQSVYARTTFVAIKAMCASGVIYWRWDDNLLWYDTEKDLAGLTALPVIDGKVIDGHIHIGVYGGKITCCRAWEDGVDIWILTIGVNWDRLHAANWNEMMDTFDFCHHMCLRSKSRSHSFFKRRIVRAVGYDGRFVYIAVQLRSGHATEELFAWDTETRQVEKKGLIGRNSRARVDEYFNYSNSMARVPQTLNRIS